MKTLTALSVGLVLLAATVTEAKGPIFGLRGLGAAQSPPASLGAPEEEPTFARPGAVELDGPQLTGPQVNGPQLGDPQLGGPQFNGPLPGPQIEVLEVPGELGPLPMNSVPAGVPVTLHAARYKDLRNVHPCAVKTIIQVKDPCYRYRPCRDCSPPPMVCIEVCLPPGCPKISGHRDLSHVRYNYGKYQVEVTSRFGRIVVDYDD